MFEKRTYMGPPLALVSGAHTDKLRGKVGVMIDCGGATVAVVIDGTGYAFGRTAITPGVNREGTLTSIARVDSGPLGHAVLVNWGSCTTVHGPYRWRWMALFVAWMEDGQH